MTLWLKGASHLLGRVIRPTTRAVNGIGSAALGVMMLMNVVNVVLRYFFDLPIKGTLEVTELLMIIVVFFAIGYTALLKGHIVIHILTSLLSERAQAIGDSIAYFISIAFCCLLIWQSFVQAQISRLHNDIIGAIDMPVFPFYYVLVLGSALMCLVFLANLLESLGAWLKK
ncbi:TRAP transporter small permease [Thermodesulfobacteriota bacterium]